MDTALITRLAHKVILSTGWRRSILAMLAGAFGALALAPVNALPAIIVSLVIAVWLIDGCSGDTAGKSRSGFSTSLVAARIGWWFGFGYFVAGLWWLGAAFLVEADKFAWALPLGVIGLPAGLAIFFALGFFLSRLLWSGGAGRIFAITAGLGLSEWLRGVVLTGFPWNDLGMVLGGNLLFGQIGSVVGLHGLTFLTIALAAAPATLIDNGDGNRRPSLLRKNWLGPTTIACLVLLCVGIFGALRLGANPTAYAAGVQLRLMQPNLAQDKKFNPQAGPEILAGYLKLSDRATSPQTAGIAGVTHLFWPESPFPFLLSQNADALARIGKFLPRSTTLITGAARADRNTTVKSRRGRPKLEYYNSIHLIESGGLITQTYDKMVLVPFGEYLPFSSFLERIGLQQFVHIPGGFSHGNVLKTLNVPKIGEIAPLICYEAIFPGVVSARTKQSKRPKLIVNLTNDGWFGPTSGPHQHMAQARLRTIEEGLPMVRVANTGISAVIDPHGRVLQSLPVGVDGVIDSPLPQSAEPTIYSSFRFAIPGSMAGLFLLFAIFAMVRTRA